MRLVIPVPFPQRGIADILKKKLQRRGLNVAIAEYHIEPASMTGRGAMLFQILQILAHEVNPPNNAVTDRHHLTWRNHF